MFRWFTSLFSRNESSHKIVIELYVKEPIQVVINGEIPRSSEEHRPEIQGSGTGSSPNLATHVPDESFLENFEKKLSKIKSSEVKFGTDK